MPIPASLSMQPKFVVMVFKTQFIVENFNWWCMNPSPWAHIFGILIITNQIITSYWMINKWIILCNCDERWWILRDLFLQSNTKKHSNTLTSTALLTDFTEHHKEALPSHFSLSQIWRTIAPPLLHLHHHIIIPLTLHLSSAWIKS